MTRTDVGARLRSTSVPHIVVGMSHPMTCHYVCDLINRRCACWTATSPPDSSLLELVVSLDPDIVIAEVDAAGVQALANAGARCIVAVGRRNDDAYRIEVLDAGANVWIPRERLDIELTSGFDALWHSCGCETEWSTGDSPTGRTERWSSSSEEPAS